MITWLYLIIIFVGHQMFTQLRFTYEQESRPEEFFIPYVWQLVLSRRLVFIVNTFFLL